MFNNQFSKDLCTYMYTYKFSINFTVIKNGQYTILKILKCAVHFIINSI